MITIRQIAEECGVSIATVSNVINGRDKMSPVTRQKVLDTIEKYGYVPNPIAKGLRIRKTGVIGIIMEDIGQFSTPGLIEGLTATLEDYGYKPILINMRIYQRWGDKWFGNESLMDEILGKHLNEMKVMMAEGLIYVAVHAREVNKIPADFDIPSVMVYAHEENPKVPSVVIDDATSAYMAVKHLTERGHRKIAIATGEKGTYHTEQRLEGAKKALADAGIDPGDANIVYAGWMKHHGYEAAEKLLKNDPTAVFCMADRIAGGLYQYLDEKGLRAGEDISVISYDDQDIAEYFIPRLTTMALPLYKIGDTAARILIDKMGVEKYADYPGSGTVRIPCDLVERESVKDLIYQ